MEQKKNSENSRVVRAAGVVGAFTMISRVFGLIRDIVIAAFFGAGRMTDAFWVAFRIPTTLSRLLGEGALTASFIPVFTEYLHKKTKEEALDLAYNTFTFLSMILTAVTILGIVFSPFIISVIGYGFVSDPAQFALAVFLNRLMFPYVFTISLGALCMGILNSFRRFASPALSPVIWNIAIIAAALGLRSFFAEPITALAVGVLVGGVLQLCLQWPFLRKCGIRLKFRFNFRHPGLKQIVMLMIPAMLGAGITTINVLVGSTLASMLPGGSVTYLFYADRVMELPLGVFAVAIGTAVLPSFSQHTATGNMQELKSSISFALRLMLFLTIPSTFALMVLNTPIITVLFQRGAFDSRAAVYTGQALFFYGMGLWAFSVVRVLVQPFYALQDSKWPMRAGIIAFVVNLIFSLALMYPMKHKGLALANSLAAIANVLVLSCILRNKIGKFLDRAFYISVARILLSSIIMVASIKLVDYFLPWDTLANFKIRLIYLIATITAGAGTFFVSAYLLKSREIHALVNILKRRIVPS